MLRHEREFARDLVGCVNRLRDDEHAVNRVGRLSEASVHEVRAVCDSQPGELSRQCVRALDEMATASFPRRNILHAVADDIGVIVSLFQPIGFSPSLGLEAFSFESISVPTDLKLLGNSFAEPVSLIHHTAGLEPQRMVAMFPECWRYADEPDLGQNEKAWYFIDRFLVRSFEVSLPLLMRCTTRHSLTRLKTAFDQDPESQLPRYCAMWMYLHEAHHRLGALPYQDYQHLKRPLLLSSLEETRADALAIVALFDRQPIADWRELAEFILLERVMRYPVSCLLANMAPDYDSAGSHILLHFLRHQGVLSIQNGVLDVEDTWIDGMRAFSAAVARREDEAKSMLTTSPDGDGEYRATRHLAEFTCQWAGYPPPEEGQCRIAAHQRTLSPFYAEALAVLQTR